MVIWLLEMGEFHSPKAFESDGKLSLGCESKERERRSWS